MLANAIRAMRLDVDFYETVENDSTFTGQALAIVVITAFMAAIGDWIGPGDGSLGSAIGTVIAAIIGWAVWSFVTLIVGTRLFGGSSDFGQMSRVLGFESGGYAIRFRRSLVIARRHPGVPQERVSVGEQGVRAQ